MAPRRRRSDEPNGSSQLSETPSQQDESDILDEVGAEQGEGGEFLVSEDAIQEIGAVDAASVRENRRAEAIAKKQRANKGKVPYNTSDPLVMYDIMMKSWAPDGIDIHVKRLTGSPVQQVILSRPRSSTELLEALKVVHGQHAEADYEVKFLDSGRKTWRGIGRIWLQDTRPSQQQGQQPVTYPYPPGYPPPIPPGYPPSYAAPYTAPGYPQQPQPQPAPQPAAPAPAAAQPPPMPPPPPTVHFVPPPAFDPNPMMTMMGGLLDMFQRLQSAAQPPAVPAAAPAPPPPSLQMPPMPPQSDPAAVMAWAKQLFDMFQRVQATASQAAAAPPQQPQPQAQSMSPVAGMPPMQPPPGTTWVWVPGAGWVAQVLGGGGVPQGPMHRGPYRPPYPQGDYSGQRYPGQPYPGQQYPGQEPSPYYPGREQPPPAPKTATDQFREAIGVLRTAVQMADEVRDMLPGQGGEVDSAPALKMEDNSPFTVVEAGKAKILVNKSDGAMRGWESLLANTPDILKWLAEQREAIMKAGADKQERQRLQQLPPGYVEVGPGYQPPPGFVAVPEYPPAGPLPPPPVYMPPPIQPQPPPPPQTWSAPMIPGQGES